jgi:hypothetical protein
MRVGCHFAPAESSDACAANSVRTKTRVVVKVSIILNNISDASTRIPTRKVTNQTPNFFCASKGRQLTPPTSLHTTLPHSQFTMARAVFIMLAALFAVAAAQVSLSVVFAVRARASPDFRFCSQ